MFGWWILGVLAVLGIVAFVVFCYRQAGKYDQAMHDHYEEKMTR